MTYCIKRVSEMESAFGGGFIRARASLGVTSFGMQVIDWPPNSGNTYPEHDHAFDGQEEVYLLLRGSAEMALPDCVVPMDSETFVKVDPGTPRRLRTGPDGARFLVIGGVPGAAYTPAPNSVLGGPETLDDPTASSDMIPNGPMPRLASRGAF